MMLIQNYSDCTSEMGGERCVVMWVWLNSDLHELLHLWVSSEHAVEGLRVGEQTLEHGRVHHLLHELRVVQQLLGGGGGGGRGGVDNHRHMENPDRPQVGRGEEGGAVRGDCHIYTHCTVAHALLGVQ